LKTAAFPKDQKQGQVSDLRAAPIKPEIFGKDVCKRISENKESKPQYILDTYNTRYKPLSEILNTPNNSKKNSDLQKPYLKSLEELTLGPVESLSVEYYVWNSKYFMMIKYLSSDYSVQLKILAFNPEEVEKVGEVLFETEICTHVAAGENDSMGSAIAHNNLYRTYGQWVFFYTIVSDHAKKENTI
jgi:hypothetical protein